MGLDRILVIFDCDGVLVDSEYIACRIEVEELNRVGFDITYNDYVTKYAGQSQKTSHQNIEKDWGQTLPDDFAKNLHRKILAGLKMMVEPIPGIEQTLKQIPHYCMATSGTIDKIKVNLTTTELEQFFTAQSIFNSQMVENGKPAPDMFLLAARKMNVAPSQCIVIEDSTSGIKAAIAAGMLPIGFTGGRHILDKDQHATDLIACGAQNIIEDMSQLLPLLNNLFPQSSVQAS